MNSISKLFTQLITKYGEIYSHVTINKDYKNSFGSIIRHDIPNELKKITGLNESIYSIKGSHGAGRWTSVPWIAIFDKRMTISAQKGIYIVYLLNKETKELYLTLNQGATDVAQTGNSTDGKLTFTGIALSNGNKTIEELKRRAQEIRRSISIVDKYSNNIINTGSDAYDAGCICSIKYTVETMPSDTIIKQDLEAL